jgi:hypothetical protein
MTGTENTKLYKLITQLLYHAIFLDDIKIHLHLQPEGCEKSDNNNKQLWTPSNVELVDEGASDPLLLIPGCGGAHCLHVYCC